MILWKAVQRQCYWKQLSQRLKDWHHPVLGLPTRPPWLHSGFLSSCFRDFQITTNSTLNEGCQRIDSAIHLIFWKDRNERVFSEGEEWRCGIPCITQVHAYFWLCAHKSVLMGLGTLNGTRDETHVTMHKANALLPCCIPRMKMSIVAGDGILKRKLPSSCCAHRGLGQVIQPWPLKGSPADQCFLDAPHPPVPDGTHLPHLPHLRFIFSPPSTDVKVSYHNLFLSQSSSNTPAGSLSQAPYR